MAAYKLSEKAQSDIESITGYTALNFGERQAVTYTDNIHAAAQITASFPNLGRPYTTKKGQDVPAIQYWPSRAVLPTQRRRDSRGPGAAFDDGFRPASRLTDHGGCLQRHGPIETARAT
jgi:plasmid stabilization system protein ParE